MTGTTRMQRVPQTYTRKAQALIGEYETLLAAPTGQRSNEWGHQVADVYVRALDLRYKCVKAQRRHADNDNAERAEQMMHDLLARFGKRSTPSVAQAAVIPNPQSLTRDPRSVFDANVPWDTHLENLRNAYFAEREELNQRLPSDNKPARVRIGIEFIKRAIALVAACRNAATDDAKSVVNTTHEFMQQIAVEDLGVDVRRLGIDNPTNV